MKTDKEKADKRCKQAHNWLQRNHQKNLAILRKASKKKINSNR